MAGRVDSGLRRGLGRLAMGFLVICLNGAMAPAVAWRPLALDGLCPLVAWMAVQSRLPDGIIPVIVLGMVADAFSVAGPGLYPFAMAMGYLMARYILVNMECRSWWQQALLVFLSGGVIKLLLLLLSGSLEQLDLQGLVDVAVTALLSPLWFRLFRLLEGEAVQEEG